MNKGGKRPGSGRPVGTLRGVKKRVILLVDRDNEEFLSTIPNKSRFINELIRKAREA